MNSESDTNLSDANIQMHANDTNGGDTNLGHTNDTNMEGNKKNWVLVVGVIVLLTAIVALSLYIFDLFPFGQNRSESNTATSNNTQTTNTVSITPVPSISDAEMISNAKQTFLDYSSNIVNSSYLPSSEAVFSKDNSNNNNNDFVGSWETSSGSAAVRLTLSSNTNTYEIANNYVLFEYESNESSNAELADSIIPLFFNTLSQSEYKCSVIANNYNYCESFWEDTNGTKKGLGIQDSSPSSSDTQRIAVFYCEFTKESAYYSWKSCAKEFSSTSIE